MYQGFEWRYAENRKLRTALNWLKRYTFALLLNPDRFLRSRALCKEGKIRNCPFRFTHQLSGTSVRIHFCLAPLMRKETMLYAKTERDRRCFLLSYCERGSLVYLRLKRWIRKWRLGNVRGK